MKRSVIIGLLVVVALNEGLALAAQTTLYNAGKLADECRAGTAPATNLDVYNRGEVDPVKFERVLSSMIAKTKAKFSCFSYIVGVIDGSEAVSKSNKESPAFCLPTVQYSGEEPMKVFIKYMDNHPAYMHEPAVYAVLLSLMDAYPCGGLK